MGRCLFGDDPGPSKPRDAALARGLGGFSRLASRPAGCGIIFGLQLETASQVAVRITQLVIYGLPDDYYDGYRDAVRGVTTAAAAEAARRHMRPEETQVVLVGDATEIGPSVEALGLGRVEVTSVS